MDCSPLMRRLLLSKEGRSKVREQRGISATTFKRRASLPPEEREYTTSYHHVGTRAGLHPEDQPYTTEDKDDPWPPRMKGSALFYAHGGVRQDAHGNPYLLIGNRPF